MAVEEYREILVGVLKFLEGRARHSGEYGVVLKRNLNS